MKKTFLILFIFTSSLIASAEALMTFDELQSFSTKKLDVVKDMDQTKLVVKTLVAMDELDPSREAVIMLSESYNTGKNAAVYDKAINAVTNNKNKKQLEQIRKLLSRHFLNGNG